MLSFIVNLKSYEAATGINNSKFLKMCPDSLNKSDWKISYAVNPIDLLTASKISGKEIISQHVDPNPYGPYTGKISIESLLSLGIKGSLLNHSENRVSFSHIESAIIRARDLDFNITVCAADEDEVSRIAQFSPNSIAYEPPSLIGGNISVSTSKPDVIERASKICKKSGVRLLVGAGIKKAEDVKRSIELGADGILVASGVVLSRDPKNAINSLINF
ncbi:MAG: triose-phosphate isomerase [Candidatus Thermoplasmatota archaeon]|jgi:triosephosphate isomerase|nr:triose-phosphate isomerase [Candidatus Thermoplasmatota archaeon]